MLVTLTGNRDVGQGGAEIECGVPDVSNAVAERDICQVRAVVKGLVCNVGDTVGDDNAGHCPIIIKHTSPDGDDRQAIGRAGDGHVTTGTGNKR